VQAILQASAQPAVIEKAKVWDSCSQDSVTLVWSCNNIVDSLFPQQYYTGAGLVDAEAAVKLTQKLASNQLLAKPTITQSDLKLNISWDGGPADLYLNSERVARNIDSGYEYQGFQNQSVAAQIVRNGQPSEPAMVIVANSYIPDAPELQNIFLGDNILRFDAGDLELKADKVWRKYWPWDPTNLVEYSGVFESDTGQKVACAGSKNSYNNQARFTCRMPEGLASISGTFRIMGKSSELGEPSASFTAIGYRSTTSIPVTVSYGDDGMPTFTWAAVAGAQSYYYRYEREANFHCTQNTTLATSNLEIIPAGFTVSAFSEPDCSGTLLAATESITYIPLPPKPAKPTGISVLFQSFQHVEFQMANRDPQSQYRIYRSDGLMVRIQPGQQFNVPAQANEDINGRTFSYRFVQIKSSTWSDSWSEPSDPIFVTPLTVAEPNARCHFKTDVNSIACEVDAVSGAQRTRIEYLDSDYQVLQAGEYEYSQLNQFYPTGTRVPHGAVYVRTSATWGDANSKYSWYRRGPGKTILVGQQKTQQLISQVR
jgi:hypothetical protein